MSRTGGPLGLVRGPGESVSEFVFVSPDPDQSARIGEFVYFEDPAIEGGVRIYGRVTQREAVRLWPDEFMADPDIAPARVAGLLGFDQGSARSNTDLFALTVSILGHFDSQVRDFINPRITPSSGLPIHLTSSAELTRILNAVEPTAAGSALVGDLITRAPSEVPIALNVAAFTSTHLAIIATTGSGKSYLAGVLLEEMMREKNRAAVLVVDPHGEYDTLSQMAEEHRTRFASNGYLPTIRVLQPDQVKVRIDSLSEADLNAYLPDMSELMKHRLREALKRVRTRKERYTLTDLLKAVEATGRDSEDDAGNGSREDGTTQALRWRLESRLANSSLFTDSEELELTQLYQPGQLTALQLNEIDTSEQRMIVTTILRRVMKSRTDSIKHRGHGDANDLGFPVFTLLEEAHNFSPAHEHAVSSPILKRILSEGRKFGVSIGLVSQRPGRLDADVLSQCMTQCLMRIVNPVDQAKIAESIESVGRDLINELPSLSRGQAILAGASVNTPVLVKVRPRITAHGGQDINAPQEWRSYEPRRRRTAIPRDMGNGRRPDGTVR